MTLVIGKIKYIFFKAEVYILLVQGQNQRNMNFTQKTEVNLSLLQSMQVQKCVSTPWIVPLSYHFRNKVCSTKSAHDDLFQFCRVKLPLAHQGISIMLPKWQSVG